MNAASISLQSLLSDHYDDADESQPLLMLADAEIILGQDEQTHKVFVVDGKDTLKEKIRCHTHQPPNVVVVKLKRQSDEVRQLNWLIKVAKSR